MNTALGNPRRLQFSGIVQRQWPTKILTTQEENQGDHNKHKVNKRSITLTVVKAMSHPTVTAPVLVGVGFSARTEVWNQVDILTLTSLHQLCSKSVPNWI
jgi:hypothetical protein